MPQYEFFFLFFFPQWQGHASKMFIKNMAAFHSEPCGRRKHKESLFVLNKQRQEEFVYTQIWRMLPLGVSCLHDNESHVWKSKYTTCWSCLWMCICFFKWWALFTFLLVEKTHLLCLHHPRLWIRYILDFLFVVLFSLLIIWLENFASGSVHMSPVRLTFSYLSIVPCVCVNDLLAGLGRDNGRMKILMPVPYEFT